MHRFAMLTLSLCLLLGLTGALSVRAQDDPKKEETPKPEAPKAEAPKAEAPKADEPKPDAAAPKPDASASAAVTEAPLPPIPPQVEAKLEAARRAVAEAIVAAQDAGLVMTTINPPPILDILLTGRAIDERELKAKTGVSPEVFGAWFSGQGTTKDINPMKDVRIYNPSAGLKDFYDHRASILNRHIEAVRKANGTAKKEEVKETSPATAPAEKDKDDAKKDADKDEKKPEPPASEAKKDGTPEK